MRKADIANLAITEVAVADIKRYPGNPVIHPPEQIEMLCASIVRYGFNNPVLIAPSGELIAGHARLEAGTCVGLTSVPAIILPHLDEAERRAYRIADNRIAMKGTWSAELLAEEVSYLFSSNFDIAPLELGFEVGEVDFMLTPKPGTTGPATLPVYEPDRQLAAVSRVGDIWTIGAHRIACGDSTDREAFADLMGSERARAVLSDGPFNVPISGHVSGKKNRWREFPMASGEMSRDEFKSFLSATFTLQAEFSEPGALVFQFIDWRSVADMIGVGESVFDKLINIAVWVKQTGSMGSLWRSRYELICIFRVKGGKHKNFVNLGKHGRYRTNVWEYAAPNSFGSERANLKLHPTCKNSSMIADAIMDVTERGDIVLDAFLGSGTTILAAHSVGRIGRGIELDPYYVDLAVNRIAETTGLEPQHQDGRSFAEIEAERSAAAESTDG